MGRRLRTAAGRSRIAVILGTERVIDRGVLVAALVINADGSIQGFQDKGQIDPSEEGIYEISDGGRQVFQAGPITFGVSICHEGWRYPETVRWPVETRRSGRVSSALPLGRARQLPTDDVRGSGEHVP